MVVDQASRLLAAGVTPLVAHNLRLHTEAGTATGAAARRVGHHAIVPGPVRPAATARARRDRGRLAAEEKGAAEVEVGVDVGVAGVAAGAVGDDWKKMCFRGDFARRSCFDCPKSLPVCVGDLRARRGRQRPTSFPTQSFMLAYPLGADDRSGRVLSQAWRYLDTATGQPRSSQLDVPCRRKYRDSFKAKRRSSSVALSGVRMHPHPRRSMSRLVAVCAASVSASSDDALWFRAVRFVSIGGELLPSTVRQCCARFPSRQ